MDLKKLIMGGIVASILFFGLGWLVYDKLLANFMAEHPGEMIADRAKDNVQMLYLVIGNVCFGFALAFILVRAKAASAMSGLVTGAIVGGLFSAGIDSIIYALTKIESKTMMAADVVATLVIWAIVGAVSAMVMNMGNKSGS